ncbi:HEPN domain-containing protein [Streptomyces sp. NPDC086082]|uniref:ApeA N-terminal domain 1-containing protein n=1 Tax=Streptomyces sp. NPDC086082 TaxID=3365750 RepID=UPI0038131224
MQIPTALKVLLQPETYRCTWQIPDNNGGESIELSGDLNLRRDRSPEGTIYGEIPNIKRSSDAGGAGFPQEHTYPALRCNLENGRVATLLDCTVSAWQPDMAIIFAKCALVGFEPLETILFDRIKIQISNIDSNFGVSPIGRHTIPTLDNPYGSWSVEQNPESSQTWGDEYATLIASYDSSITAADPYYFRMCYSPAVLIDSSSPLTFEEALDEWVQPLLNVAALSMNRPQKITFLSLGNRTSVVGEQGWNNYQVYGTGLTQEPFNSSYSEIRQNRSVLNWKSDEVSPLTLLRNWQKLTTEHHPLIETYGSFLNVQAQHPRARFLLLIQALEGLHGHEHAQEERERTERHLERRTQILDSFKGCMALNNDAKKFLKTNLSKRPPVSLDSRLRECFESIPGDTLTRLQETEIVTELGVDPANALRIIRNDLAHGNRGYQSQDLHAVSKIIECAARAHFMRILGAGEDVQERAFQSD